MYSFLTLRICVLYVYDALVCEKKDSELVAETMSRIILGHGVKTNVKNTSGKIDMECAKVDEIVESGNNGRIRLEEHFNQCKRKYKYVKQEQFDYQYEMLSEFFKFVDEIPDELKKNCKIEYQNNEGCYDRLPLFD